MTLVTWSRDTGDNLLAECVSVLGVRVLNLTVIPTPHKRHGEGTAIDLCQAYSIETVMLIPEDVLQAFT